MLSMTGLKQKIGNGSCRGGLGRDSFRAAKPDKYGVERNSWLRPIYAKRPIG